MAAFVVSGGRDPRPGWLQPWDGQEATTHLALGERGGWEGGRGAASWGAVGLDVTFANYIYEGWRGRWGHGNLASVTYPG